MDKNPLWVDLLLWFVTITGTTFAVSILIEAGGRWTLSLIVFQTIIIYELMMLLADKTFDTFRKLGRYAHDQTNEDRRHDDAMAQYEERQ